jgi:preprotein translocase subunit SecD
LVITSVPGNSRSDQVAASTMTTLDLYPQSKPNPVTLRTSGNPVLHLTVVRAEVISDSHDQFTLIFGFDAASQKEFSAIGPGQQVAFVVDGQLVSAPVFQAHIHGDAQLTGEFTVETATRLAHRLTDNVVVTAG